MDPGDENAVPPARGRAAVACVCVAAGFCVARVWEGPAWHWWAIATACIAVGCFTRGRACLLFLSLSLASVSGGWFTARVLTVPDRDVSRLLATSAPGSPLTVEGVVTSGTRERPAPASLLSLPARAAGTWSFELAAQRGLTDEGTVRVSGVLRVHVAGGEPGVRPGDPVRLIGRFSPVAPPDNPGEAPTHLLARQDGVSGSLRLSDPSLITPIAADGTLARARSDVTRVLGLARARASDVVSTAAGSDPRDRALLAALILGEYDPDASTLRAAWARQGLAHLLSISGFHLAVMAWLLLTTIRLTGDWGHLEPLLVALIVLAYWLLVPASAPLSRSAAMVLVLLLAEALGRRYDRVTLLLWIAIGLLAWRPLDLWSLGFQMSVGLTGLLLWLGGAFNDRLWGPRLRGTVRRSNPTSSVAGRLRQGISASLLCWVVSLPAIMHHVGIVSPLGILATLLITPLVTLVLWIAYASLAAGVLFPPVASLASSVIAWLLRGADRCVSGLDSFPLSSVDTPPVSGWWAVASTLTLLLISRRLSTPRGKRREGAIPRLTLAAVLAFAWLALQWTLIPGPARGVDLRIDTLAVGDGTCHLVRSRGQVMLWDAGPMSTGGLRPQVVRAARALGVHHVPTLVVSHPDSDHFGGLVEAVEGLGVRNVLVTERFLADARERPAGAAARALSFLAERGVRVGVLAAGDTWQFGAATVTILSPAPDAPWPTDNDHSLVAHLATPRGTLLLTGDIADHAIASLDPLTSSLSGVDILELPHHGSVRTPSVDWARRLSPRVVIQSAGPTRARESAPAWRALRERAAWLCTGERGACWAELGSDGTVRAGSLAPPPL
ncbi:MAG: ComEC/Rec2 family competence protein [Phycisphaerales bacterium]|nr:ComEC/Rec2 family competence protein [Phycisphaerales bacterium]